MNFKPALPNLQPVLLWFFASLAIFWLGNDSHSLWDRDEPRYAVATREMVQSGDYIVPHFNGEVRYDKPVLVYWLMTIPAQAFGINNFSVRAAQGVGGALTVALLFLFAARMGASSAARHLAAAMGAGCLLLTLISKAATTDSWLVFFTLCALLAHWEHRMRRDFSWPLHLLFWSFVALGALQKGPVTPMVAGLAVLTERLWRLAIGDLNLNGKALAVGTLRFVAGLAVLAALGAIWVVPVTIATDGDFLYQSVGKHVVERAKESLEGHGGPFFYYFLVLPVAVFPFTAAVFSGITWAFGERSRAQVRLLWSWLIPSFIIFSLVRTKLPHYIAPLLPSVILMAALWLTVWEAKGGAIPLRKSGAIFIGSVGSLLALGLPIAVTVLGMDAVLPAVIVMGIFFATGTLTGAKLWLRHEPKSALAVWGGGQALVLITALLWGLPVLERYRPSEPVAEWIHENAPSTPVHVAAVEYQEPSLVFYWGRQIEMFGKQEQEEGMERLREDRPVAIVMTKSRWRKWRERYDGIIPPEARVGFSGDFYMFEGGGWDNMHVIVNWPES